MWTSTLFLLLLNTHSRREYNTKFTDIIPMCDYHIHLDHSPTWSFVLDLIQVIPFQNFTF